MGVTGLPSTALPIDLFKLESSCPQPLSWPLRTFDSWVGRTPDGVVAKGTTLVSAFMDISWPGDLFLAKTVEHADKSGLLMSP